MPAYRERDRLPLLFSGLSASGVMEVTASGAVELIVIDDGSGDGTADLAASDIVGRVVDVDDAVDVGGLSGVAAFKQQVGLFAEAMDDHLEGLADARGVLLARDRLLHTQDLAAAEALDGCWDLVVEVEVVVISPMDDQGNADGLVKRP